MWRLLQVPNVLHLGHHDEARRLREQLERQNREIALTNGRLAYLKAQMDLILRKEER